MYILRIKRFQLPTVGTVNSKVFATSLMDELVESVCSTVVVSLFPGNLQSV